MKTELGKPWWRFWESGPTQGRDTRDVLLDRQAALNGDAATEALKTTLITLQRIEDPAIQEQALRDVKTCQESDIRLNDRFGNFTERFLEAVINRIPISIGSGLLPGEEQYPPPRPVTLHRARFNKTRFNHQIRNLFLHWEKSGVMDAVADRWELSMALAWTVNSYLGDGEFRYEEGAISLLARAPFNNPKVLDRFVERVLSEAPGDEAEAEAYLEVLQIATDREPGPLSEDHERVVLELIERAESDVKLAAPTRNAPASAEPDPMG